MFWTLVHRELLDHLLRWRFLGTLVVSTVLFVIAAFAFTSKYPLSLKAESGSFSRMMYGGSDERALRNRVGNYVNTPRKPIAIQFAADGDDKFIPSRLAVRADGRMESGYIRSGAANYLLGRFQDIDWIFIVGIVLTFAAIVLSYDSVSGDLEDGTLKLVLSNSVSRASVLLAKFSGAFVSLLVPLIVGCLASLLVIYSSGLVIFDADLRLKLLAVLLLSCIYLALIVWISIFVSTWLGRSSATLVVLLVFYVVTVLLIPGLAGVLGAKLVQVDAPNVARAREMALMGLPTSMSIGGGGGGEARMVIATRIAPGSGGKLSPEERRKALEERMRLTAERQKQVTKYRQELQNHRERQLDVAVKIAMVSPYGLYKHAASALAGTGIYRYDRFMKQLKTFGNTLSDFFLQQEGLDSQSAQPTDCSNPSQFSADIIVPDDRMPQFVEAKPNLAETASDAVIPGGLLLGISTIVFFGAFLAFARKAVN